MSDMTDEQLVGYIDSHCETDRALTSGRHIKRLLALAGKPENHLGEIDDGFYGFHEDIAKPLVKRARERLASPGQEEIPGVLDA